MLPARSHSLRVLLLISLAAAAAAGCVDGGDESTGGGGGGEGTSAGGLEGTGTERGPVDNADDARQFVVRNIRYECEDPAEGNVIDGACEAYTVAPPTTPGDTGPTGDWPETFLVGSEILACTEWIEEPREAGLSPGICARYELGAEPAPRPGAQDEGQTQTQG